jgi:hypothetical protein
MHRLTVDAEYAFGAAVPQPLKPTLRRGRDLIRGFWPRQVADYRLEHWPRDPRTFSEKVQYRVAYDRRPHLTLFADKAGVRDFVAERVGRHVLTDCLGVYDSADAVPWDRLPRGYAIKATHGSGGLVLVTDAADPSNRLPGSARNVGWDRYTVRPEHAVQQRIAAIADKWMTLNYHYGTGRLPEFAYRDVPPRILIEHLLTNRRGAIAADWKCFVFDGVLRILTIESDRFGDHRQEVFARDGSRLGRFIYDPPDELTPLPANFDELVSVAESLGREIDFVRVDLYNIDGSRVVFGELTNYPGAGRQAFPGDWDRMLGDWWTLAT